MSKGEVPKSNILLMSAEEAYVRSSTDGYRGSLVVAGVMSAV